MDLFAQYFRGIGYPGGMPGLDNKNLPGNGENGP